MAIEIEVFADVACPFTHVGLRRFVERRAERGDPEPVHLRVRSWPLEVVNGQPLDPEHAAEAAAAARAALGPSRDPWRRSTSPNALAAYRALGIDWEANWDEVATVFREQAARWHPDRLAGADERVQAEGQRRMSEMTRAYRELQRILRPQHRQLFTT